MCQAVSYVTDNQILCVKFHYFPSDFSTDKIMDSWYSHILDIICTVQENTVRLAINFAVNLY